MAKSKPQTKPPIATAAEDNPAARKIAAHKAAIKQLEGKTLTERETRDLGWLNKSLLEEARGLTLAALPKGVYCELAGRQQKVIDEQAQRYDLPLLGPAINLAAAIKSLHDRVIELAAQTRPDLDGDLDELKAEKLRQEIKRLEAQSEMLRIDISRRQDQLIDRAAVRDALLWLSGQLRSLGVRMARESPETQRALNEFLESLAIEIKSGRLAL